MRAHPHTWLGLAIALALVVSRPAMAQLGAVTAGYRFDFWRSGHVALGVGALGSISIVPVSIRDVYGDNPTSGVLFGHVELR